MDGRRRPQVDLRVDATGLISEPLGVQELLAVRPQAVADVRLAPDYDEPFLRWIFDELDAVRSRAAEPLGDWFVTGTGLPSDRTFTCITGRHLSGRATDGRKGAPRICTSVSCSTMRRRREPLLCTVERTLAS